MGKDQVDHSSSQKEATHADSASRASAHAGMMKKNLPPGKTPLQKKEAVSFPAVPVAQMRVLDLGTHGNIDTGGNFHEASPVDAPQYGGNVAVGGLGNAGSSMETIVTPNHPAGSSPNALNDIFAHLPTVGKYKLPANAARGPATGSTLYIKGHLLNDNLGGPGSQSNLYPITGQANADHSNLIEEPLKNWVNQRRGIAYYKVEVTGGAGGDIATDTNMVDEAGGALSRVNANFRITIDVLRNDDSTFNVVTNRLIRSQWNAAPNNGAALAFPGDPKQVSVPGAALRLPPRATRDHEWDFALHTIAQQLAGEAKLTEEEWYQTISGIGKKGAELLAKKAELDPSAPKAMKATLTRARGMLRAYLEELDARKATVTAAVDSGSDTRDVNDSTDVIEANKAPIANSVQNVDELEAMIDEMILSFSRLSIGGPSASAAASAPVSAMDADAPKRSRKQAHPRRALPPGTKGTVVFDMPSGDFVEAPPMSFRNPAVAKLRAPVAAGVTKQETRERILAGMYDIVLVNIYNEFPSVEEGIVFYIELLNN